MNNQEELFQVQVYPDTAWIQQGRQCQRLNHDFWFQSSSPDEWLLQQVKISIYDEASSIVLKKRLDNQALRPSITTLPERSLSPNGSLYLFNPFPEFDRHLTLGRLHYAFQFESEAGEIVSIRTDVFPKTYQQQVKLTLPLRGRVLVDDGNDYYSHHRRVVMKHPLTHQLGMTGNDQRFAWDFVFIDEEGKDYHTDERHNEHYYSFGKPIYAPGAGTVVALRNDIPDNEPYKVEITPEAVQQDPPLISGNQVIIDHGNQEYSVLAHCLQGSVCVTVGNMVAAGDLVARLGNSGWTAYPHLHYALIDRPDMLHAEGLPACFSEFDLVIGNKMVSIANASPNTGEIIRSRLV